MSIQAIGDQPDIVETRLHQIHTVAQKNASLVESAIPLRHFGGGVIDVHPVEELRDRALLWRVVILRDHNEEFLLHDIGNVDEFFDEGCV